MLGLPKDKVVLCPHNENWTQCFIEEKRDIISEIGNYTVDIHHFGSAAIPGIAAKPIIDIAISLKRLDDVENCKQGLEKLGYECHGEMVVKGCYFFSKGNPTTYHIHFTNEDNVNMKRWLFFKDRIMASDALALEYETLKKYLQDQFKNDRKGYNKGKDKFIHRVLADMKK